MNEITIGSDEWLNQVKEEIIEPEIRIIDPHHHLWDFSTSTYLVKELQEDTSSGHKVEKPIYMECGGGYYEEGPEHLKLLVKRSLFLCMLKKVRKRGVVL
ncbi:MAG: hypothetical protein Ct9H90mP4_08320 [Gammaproteobacteria bacterium]|nr:MAG: hypothetical protein Ct9H90mP4_08320 [Gammaproteobacteria bacterium]